MHLPEGCRVELQTIVISLVLSVVFTSPVRFDVKLSTASQEVSRVNIELDLPSRVLSIEQVDVQAGYHNRWSVLEKQDLQVFKTTVLGELDLNQPPSFTICFIHSLTEHPFIPSDVVKRLTQLDANMDHSADVHLEEYSFSQDREVTPANISNFGANAVEACQGCQTVYISERDVRLISRGDVNIENAILNSTTELPREEDSQYPTCRDASPLWTYGCFCERTMCFDWFPCRTEFCHSVDELGSDISYVCGIKSCRQCQVRRFYVPKRSTCFWNVP